MKNIYISHGDKGGCGKSLWAMTLGSILSKNKKHFLLVEADANQRGGQPDVAPRFENDPYASVVMAPIAGFVSPEDMIADLFEMIEHCDEEHVVINTPAGVSETLEQVGELIGLACQHLGYRLVIFYSLFKTEVAVNQAKAVLDGHLAQYATEFYFIKNEFFGVPDLPRSMAECPSVTVPILHKNVTEKIKKDMNLAQEWNAFSMMQKMQVQQFFTKLRIQGVFDILLCDH